MNYLILENDTIPSFKTQKYIEKKINEGEKVETQIISPMDDHSTVVDAMKFGYIHTILLEPTIYRATQLNKVGHDVLHSWRVRNFFYGKDERYLLEKFVFVDHFENMLPSLRFVGLDAIASVAGIAAVMPTYTIDENYNEILLTSETIFEGLKKYIFGADDVNIRFNKEWVENELKK